MRKTEMFCEEHYETVVKYRYITNNILRYTKKFYLQISYK